MIWVSIEDSDSMSEFKKVPEETALSLMGEYRVGNNPTKFRMKDMTDGVSVVYVGKVYKGDYTNLWIARKFIEV